MVQIYLERDFFNLSSTVLKENETSVLTSHQIRWESMHKKVD